MHPRALIPNVGHGEKIRIQTGLLHGELKHGFMSPRAARRNHYPIELVFLDDLQELLLRVLGTREKFLVSKDNVRQRPDVLDYPWNVHHVRDIDAATANEDPYARFLA